MYCVHINIVMSNCSVRIIIFLLLNPSQSLLFIEPEIGMRIKTKLIFLPEWCDWTKKINCNFAVYKQVDIFSGIFISSDKKWPLDTYRRVCVQYFYAWNRKIVPPLIIITGKIFHHELFNISPSFRDFQCGIY